MKEIWKNINGYDGYKVSNFGDVKSYKLNKPKKLSKIPNPNDYLRVFLRCNGKTKTRYIHRLVANAFIPNNKNKKCINHVDGDKSNNSVHNLEWVSYKENMIHASENNLLQTGIDRHNAKLQDNDVLSIKDMYLNKNHTYKEISEKFGVSISHVGNIIKNRRRTTINPKHQYNG